MNQKYQSAITVTFVYFIFSFLWIFLSDNILLIFAEDIDQFQHISTIKGIAFILISSIIIYLLVSKAVSKNKKAIEKNRKIVESLIITIQSITESRDPYTTGHETRVADISVLIGKKLGLSGHRLEGLKTGALLHDLGKIMIPLEILNKPGKLTDIEYDLVMEHPEAGYNFIKTIEFDWPISKMIRQHHEKCDGSGYPQGLEKDDIMLEARIICVADILEAMSSDRPYRPELGINEALAVIKAGRGVTLDERVVDACIELVENNLIDFVGWKKQKD